MAAPGYYVGGYYGHVAEMESDNNNTQLAIDELLNFPKEDEAFADSFFDTVAGNSTDSSSVTAVDSSGCRSFSDAHFSGELCVPYDDLAELEWLSNFVDDSSSDGLHNHLQFIPTTTTTAMSSPENLSNNPSPFLPSDVSVPGKARSKRSRAAPCDWSSRLLPLSPKPSPKTIKKPVDSDPSDVPVRKCLHCGSEKTPQWRTGPMGPKTLCNACGVRHKSGRLVPEYRPAASPTFVSAKHSNSHRKVLELRRQKEMQRQQQFISQGSIFGVSNGGDEYLIHHHSSSDYSHMI